jgi:glycosyltransferase involved in cell wall biosynthesis
MDISLIVPTYGRYKEVEMFLYSISQQTYPLQKVEVIIVDQNDAIDLTPIINKYAALLNIVYKKINVKSSANAKNIGIQMSKAPLITFPDDDCTFYKDTVESAISFFQKESSVDIAYGRIYDRKANANIMRNWANKDIELNMYNFHLNYSAITCFSKRKDIFYDSRFGTGAPYFSGDELDYVITAIGKKYKVVYTNSIDIWHPQLNLSVMPLQKVYNYAIGYGAVCKKNAKFPITYLFGKSVVNQILQVIKNSLLFKKEQRIKHYAALKGRVTGFLTFKN